MHRFMRQVLWRGVPLVATVVVVVLIVMAAPATPLRVQWPETVEHTWPAASSAGSAAPPDVVGSADPTGTTTTSTSQVTSPEVPTTTTPVTTGTTTTSTTVVTGPPAAQDDPPPPEPVSLVDRCWAAIASSGLSAPSGWSVHCEPPDRERDGWCSPGTRSLHVAPDPEDSHRHVEHVYAHEIGHAVHIDYVTTEDEWRRWAAARGFDYPAELPAMMEDFAEAFACYVGWCDWLVLPPADAALLRELMET